MSEFVAVLQLGLLLPFAVCMLALGCSALRRGVVLLWRGVKVEGTVVAQERDDEGCPFVTVRYQFSGQPFAMRTGYHSGKVGDKVPLRVDPANPAAAELDRASRCLLFPACSVLAGLVLGAYVAICIDRLAGPADRPTEVRVPMWFVTDEDGKMTVSFTQPPRDPKTGTWAPRTRSSAVRLMGRTAGTAPGRPELHGPPAPR